MHSPLSGNVGSISSPWKSRQNTRSSSLHHHPAVFRHFPWFPHRRSCRIHTHPPRAMPFHVQLLLAIQYHPCTYVLAQLGAGWDEKGFEVNRHGRRSCSACMERIIERRGRCRMSRCRLLRHESWNVEVARVLELPACLAVCGFVDVCGRKEVRLGKVWTFGHGLQCLGKPPHSLTIPCHVFWF